jgi:histidinol dehydrogenase
MCCVPAKVAGVERVAVVSPPGSSGAVNPAVLAAAAIAGADEVYATGGVQAIAALALGTESIAPVDVIVGPGNRYVQEAKRQLYGRVGIDGIAGPSELMVVCDRSAKAEWIALDLCSQAEHGDDGLLVAASDDAATLDEVEAAVEQAVAARPGAVQDAPFALVKVPSVKAGVELANALAPEHLELECDGAEELSPTVTTAGCVFVGNLGATAFGDYAAGSNHVLPTGGAGRYTGPLGPTVFRRRIGTVKLTQEAAQALAPAVGTLARSEGFPIHAESVEARLDSEGERK